MDRERARDWLAGWGQGSGSPVRALQLALSLKPGVPVRVGMSGSTTRLESLGGKHALFLALGIAGILMGEGLLRPVETPAVKGRKRKVTSGPQLGRCNLSRPGYQLLTAAGHPRAVSPGSAAVPADLPAADAASAHGTDA